MVILILLMSYFISIELPFGQKDACCISQEEGYSNLSFLKIGNNESFTHRFVKKKF
jgi:hypothetical protein